MFRPLLILLLKKEIILCENDFNQEIRNLSNIEINNCYFERTSMLQGNGGVIYCSEISCNLILKNSIFFYCFSLKFGGAIYFFCNFPNTKVEIINVCGNLCFSEIYQFGYFLVQNNILSLNSINFLSISNCNNKQIGYSTFTLQYGNISFNNLNSSNNFNILNTGFDIHHSKLLNIIFCTIFNNNVKSYDCIRLEGGFNNSILYSNIIKNNSPRSFGVVSNFFGNLEISNCIFFNN